MCRSEVLAGAKPELVTDGGSTYKGNQSNCGRKAPHRQALISAATHFGTPQIHAGLQPGQLGLDQRESWRANKAYCCAFASSVGHA